MKWCIVVVCALAGFQAHAAQDDIVDVPPQMVEDKGDLTIEYHPSRLREADKSTSITYRVLSEGSALEAIVRKFNESYSLERSLRAVFQDCGKENAYYDHNTATITVCYELIGRYADAQADDTPTISEIERARMLAAQFLFTHQLGHALMQEFRFPAEASKESFVQQYIAMLQGNQDDTDALNHRLAQMFIVNEAKTTASLAGLGYAKEHPFAAAYARGLLCMAYGLDPQAHADYVSTGLLAKERADSCEYEYSQSMTAWQGLITPFAKQAEALPSAAEVWQ